MINKTSNPFFYFLIVTFCLLLTPETYADQEFRDHRFNSFQTLPPSQEGDIVFIGNSITNMMNWNELFGNSKNIKNRGTSGAFTKEILENLESMIAGNPSKIFLMIGTNDLGTEGFEFQPGPVAYRIKKILKRIREEVPEAEVYYQSILPTLKGLRTEKKTLETNALIEEWIKEQNDPKLNYIDIYSSLVDSDGGIRNTQANEGEHTISYDGLHFTQEGYKIWADIIAPFVGVQSAIPGNAVNLRGNLKNSPGMRATYFGALPVYSSDILLIGDEMINGGEWHELFGDGSFKDRGFGWGYKSLNVENVGSILDPILSGNSQNGVVKQSPKAVCLYVGLTDLENGKGSIELSSVYKNLVDSLQDKLPQTPIFLMTVCPVNTDDMLESEINNFNEEIKNLINKDRNVYLIDTYSATIDENGERIEDFFMGAGSPYLSGMGYVAVANEIANSLNKLLGENYKPMSLEEGRNNQNEYQQNSNIKNATDLLFDNTTSPVPYRIPAIAKTIEGDLISVVDYRYSKADIGMAKNGKLDLRYRIKDSKTGEWSEEKTLAAAFGEGDNNVAFGDPCIVADRESNRILVTSCSGNVSFPKGTHDNHQGWARFYSEDGGKTWSGYEEIGNQVFNLLDKRDDGNINAFFIGSGKITQSDKIKNGDYYRIYCAALVRVNDGKTKVNYVLYSDDFGKNWNLLGDVNDCPIPYGADEPKTEELPDGSVLVSSRVPGGRSFNIFKYTDAENGEGNWSTMAISNSENNGVIASQNACNGETLCIPATRISDGAPTFLLLQSVPLNREGKRANVGINFKDLDSTDKYSSPEALAANWNGTYEVTPYSSAYSTMVLDKDNDIAFFYEENSMNGGYDMILKKLSIEDITNGQYIFRNE